MDAVGRPERGGPGPEAGWGSAETIVALLGGALFIGLFPLVESRTAHPLMPLRLFRNRSPVAVANANTHTTTGPDLVPGLRTAGFTAAVLTLRGVAIALTLRRPGSTPSAAAAVTETRLKTESGISA